MSGDYEKILQDLEYSIQCSQMDVAEKNFRSRQLKNEFEKMKATDSISNRFHELAHEIYSFTFLRRFGETVIAKDSKNVPGCDLVLLNQYYIECTCPNPGYSQNDFDQLCAYDVIHDYNIKKKIVNLRLINALSTKADAYDRYVGRNIPRDKPYIIFLALGSLNNGYFAGENGFALTDILFGRGNLQVIVNSDTGAFLQTGYSHNTELIKNNGSTVNCNLFCTERFRCVSGIIFTSAMIGNQYNESNTWLYINPFATNKIRMRDFEDMIYWLRREDNQYAAYKNGKNVN